MGARFVFYDPRIKALPSYEGVHHVANEVFEPIAIGLNETMADFNIL